MKLTIVISILATTFLTANANDIQAGMILGGANTEYGVGSHIFYVMYPGIEEPKGSAKFVIMRTDENNTELESVHTYTVVQGEENKPYTHFFAIQDKTKDAKYYSIKFCNGANECSKHSSPPTWVDNGEAKLDCQEISGEVKDIAIPAVSKYATDEELKRYKAAMGKSLAVKDSIETNSYYKKITDEEGYIYFLLYYPLYEFRTLFTVQEDSDGYCRKKYNFIVLTHLVNKVTKMIVKRSRFTPRKLSDDEIQTFILSEDNKEIPIEFKMDVKLQEAQKSNLEVWQTVCLSAKDMVSTREKGLSTRCSQPFIRDWDNSQVDNE